VCGIFVRGVREHTPSLPIVEQVRIRKASVVLDLEAGVEDQVSHPEILECLLHGQLPISSWA